MDVQRCGGDGSLPHPPTKISLIPPNKPKRGASLRSSIRPIPLSCVVAKILAAMVSRDLSPALEPTLGSSQYAYQGGRGTEVRLLKLYNSLCAALARGRYVHLAAVAVDGAFGDAPHAGLITSPQRAGVDSFSIRYAAKWLQSRIFCVRLRTPAGAFYSR